MQALHRLHFTHPTHAWQPSNKKDNAVTALPATAALPMVAMDPATAALPMVAMDPATAMLARVPMDPATATLPVVAIEAITPALAVVAIENGARMSLWNIRSVCQRWPCMKPESDLRLRRLP